MFDIRSPRLRGTCWELDQAPTPPSPGHVAISVDAPAAALYNVEAKGLALLCLARSHLIGKLG
jgi:hypothetical protein